MPSAPRRSVQYWASISRVSPTPSLEVAKWSCQLRVMRSSSGLARAHRAVEPPEHVVAVGVDRVERGAVDAGRPAAEGAAARREQRVDAGGDAGAGRALGLARTGAEPGPPQQPVGAGPVRRPHRHQEGRRLGGSTVNAPVIPRAAWSPSEQ